MFTIGDVDVTFLIPIVLCFCLFGLQLLLCFKAKHMAVKLIPVYIIILILLFSLYLEMAHAGTGWLDLTGFVAVFMAVVALVLGLFVGAAWLVWKWKTK